MVDRQALDRPVNGDLEICRPWTGTRAGWQREFSSLCEDSGPLVESWRLAIRAILTIIGPYRRLRPARGLSSSIQGKKEAFTMKGDDMALLLKILSSGSEESHRRSSA